MRQGSSFDWIRETLEVHGVSGKHLCFFFANLESLKNVLLLDTQISHFFWMILGIPDLETYPYELMNVQTFRFLLSTGEDLSDQIDFLALEAHIISVSSFSESNFWKPVSFQLFWFNSWIVKPFTYPYSYHPHTYIHIYIYIHIHFLFRASAHLLWVPRAVSKVYCGLGRLESKVLEPETEQKTICFPTKNELRSGLFINWGKS